MIIQDDRFDTASIAVCGLTTNPADTPAFRLIIEPSLANGLVTPSRLMVDKVVTIPRAKLGRRIGVLGESDVRRLNDAIVVFLGLAG